ncbi:hypothetical protein IMG5_183460 [Ichthyophthirius multifiliis]|uniref:Transmembrane protein n=1 Tax=Ichthyophthirius multifiliis TaxID=5932 RepID=G0R366_ICHMU|nr:hypothetical protein IMG5_183460 [Ichthyophthirius multifiliis]EGR28089.1 hypothetical protein IMG5_183460 [Ichthyophthirius multifiliis]|eukprot:XP_004027434.1 hypothetical protein IMG5_183460 [Ichthyophthirius multifiliis]
MQFNLSEKIIKKIDIFGQPVALNIDNKSIYKTECGGAITILTLFGFLIFYFNQYILNTKINFYIYIFFFNDLYFLKFQSFLNKNQIFVIQQYNLNYTHDSIVFDNENYMFALQIKQQDFIKSPFYSIKVQYKEKNEEKENNQIINLEPCTTEHFQNLKKGQISKEEYNKYNLNDYLCLPKKFTFQIKGTYYGNNLNFLKIQRIDCKNYQFKICQNQECLDQFLIQNQGNVILNILQTNSKQMHNKKIMFNNLQLMKFFYLLKPYLKLAFILLNIQLQLMRKFLLQKIQNKIFIKFLNKKICNPNIFKNIR